MSAQYSYRIRECTETKVCAGGSRETAKRYTPQRLIAFLWWSWWADMTAGSLSTKCEALNAIEERRAARSKNVQYIYLP
jgi:hypothetical protein